MPMKSTTRNNYGIHRNKITNYLANNRDLGLGNAKIPFPTENIWGWYLASEAYSDAGFETKVTADNGRVYGLKDVNPAGTNNHLIQPNGSLQPFYRSTTTRYTINSLPTILYYGGLVHQTTLNVPDQLSMYIVSKTSLDITNNAFCQIASEIYFNFNLFSFPTNPLRMISGNKQVEVSPATTPALDAAFVASWHIGSSGTPLASARFNDGVGTDFLAGTYTADANKLIVGQTPSFSTKDTNIVEMILYSTRHGAGSENDNVICNYLINKYNLGITI